MNPVVITDSDSLLEKKQRLAELLRAKLAKPRRCPVSYTQRRLWLLQQMEPESPLYNVPHSVRLIGELDLKGLEQSLSGIAQRHEVLRTQFPLHEGEPVQEIHPAKAVKLPIVDLSGFADHERELLAQDARQEEAECPFALETEHLFRVRLVRLKEQEYELLLTMHHMVTDDWSYGIFTQELEAFYTAYVNGQSPSLPPLEIQYADYASWQLKNIGSEELQAQTAWWRKHLAAAPVLNLPEDRVEPSGNRARERGFQFTFSAETSLQLKEWGQREGMTPFMSLLAGFSWLLGRYARTDDVIIGTIIANRNRPETERVIGPFVNTLPLRIDLSGGPSFRALAKRVREVTLGAYAHQDVPFETLVEELSPKREQSGAPLFQAMLVLQNATGDQLRLPGLNVVGNLELEMMFPLMHLAVEMAEKPTGELEGNLLYDPGRFRRGTMERLWRAYELLSRKSVVMPDLPLTEHSLLDEQEALQILVDWNRTEADYPEQRCIHQLIEEQVQSQPHATAAVFRETTLSYLDLDRKANQMARQLQSFGVGPEIRVAMCMERGLDMLVAIIGTLKAGGAYVPLDPAYPRERLEFMMEDTGPAVLLTQTKFRERFTGAQPAIVCLDEEPAQFARYSQDPVECEASAANLAYIIYTSGSTGRPKGVLITHGGLCNVIAECIRRFQAGPGWRIAQLASLSFDASVLEIFMPLCTGGQLHVVDQETLLSSSRFAGLLQDQDINITVGAPSVFNILPYEQEFPDLRVMIVGGEVCPPATAARWARGRELFNVYAPTESTIFSTTFQCTGHSKYSPLVGKPIGNTRVYILDENVVPVPVGVPGEIYLGGVGIARGYWNRPELTAERFVPDPFSGTAAARLYKSGDLARYTHDGNLEFLGRVDHQVKLRGYRIELGEIEANLLQHESVREAVVILWEEDNDKKLVAYVVAKKDAEVQVNVLRLWLQKRLPEYMVPAAIMVLEDMPRMVNGKVERQALPAPTQDADAVRNYAAPRNEMEEAICRIWAETLGIERVGVEDSFFDLGGHSLLATRVMSQVRSEFGIEVPLRVLFEQPKVAGFALEVEKLQREGQTPEFSISPVERGGDIPLSYAQRRLWFVHKLQPDSVAYNAPFNFRLVGNLDRFLLQKCLTEIVRRHEILRTTFPAHEGEPVQKIHPPLPVMLPMVDLSGIEAKDRSGLARQLRQMEAERPFNLARYPIFEAKLVRLGETEYELLTTMHHMVNDGWSSAIFVHELSALWTAYMQGKPSPLPEPKIQYADYAVWQRRWLETEVLDQQMPYWRKQLTGSTVLDLPTDYPRKPIANHPGATLPFALSRAQSEGIAELGRQEGATVFMVMLAAFQWLLSRLSGQEDISIGTVIANRNRKETESLMGCFVNTLVLRTDVSGAPTFRKLVKRVRELTLSAYAHQDVPFEKLVEELNPERDLLRSPLFQVRFALDNGTGTALDLAGLQVESIEMELPQIKFDLTLLVQESADRELKGYLVYAADLFERAGMARLLERYALLLQRALASPDSPLPHISLSEENEQRQVLEDWNRSERSYSLEECTHEIFERQVRSDPHASAVVYEGARLSYAELNARANQLARYLNEMGVGPEVRVGICMDRNLDLIIALLGILKAGGAYVPIDPSLPSDRVGFLLEDAEIPVLLTTEQHRNRLPSQWIQTVCLDTEWDSLAGLSLENLDTNFFPENLAYVIYTSGSAGKPKAVGVEHRQIVNYANAVTERMKCPPKSRFAFVSTIAADLGNTVLFAALLHGGELHVISEETARDARKLCVYFRENKIDCTKITPSHLASLQVVQETEDLLPRDLLVLGGEAFQWKWAEGLRKLRPSCRMMNHYGPTECTVGALAGFLDELLEAGSVNVPLGRPLANTRLYVLGESMAPLPPGMVGELYIGGAGVARGYLKREDLTAERFVPDPFSDHAGARLYRTGDRARWLSNGTLEFLGRIDHQVKIRGFRVELGEIESALKQHPEVRQSAVVLREDAGQKKLLAYVSLRDYGVETIPERLHKLPNGLTIAHHNATETEYLYRANFQSPIYAELGMDMPADACVFDVGANIGMFTLFAGEQCPRGRIFAFEPIESVFRNAEYNATLCKAKTKVFNVGLSDTNTTTEFTFYPDFSMQSLLKAYADPNIEAKFQKQTQLCTLRRLSDVLREQDVDYIDLLKLDVQRAELDVLRGIDPQDWEKIGQVLLFIIRHSSAALTQARVKEVSLVLKTQGFEVSARQMGELNSGDWVVYARNQATLDRRSSLSRKTESLQMATSGDELKDYLRGRLPEYMLPAAIVVLPNLPLTPNGKLDRHALPLPSQMMENKRAFIAPRNEVEEKLCRIWEEVLQVERVSVMDNFFELGGHSLLATQIISRIQAGLQLEIPLTAIFTSPTVAQLALELPKIQERSQPDAIQPLDRKAFRAKQATM